MKIVFRIVALILFIVFFGFALKNTQEVALRFFFDYEMRGPLVLLLLAFFCRRRGAWDIGNDSHRFSSPA